MSCRWPVHLLDSIFAFNHVWGCFVEVPGYFSGFDKELLHFSKLRFKCRFFGKVGVFLRVILYYL